MTQQLIVSSAIYGGPTARLMNTKNNRIWVGFVDCAIAMFTNDTEREGVELIV